MKKVKLYLRMTTIALSVLSLSNMLTCSADEAPIRNFSEVTEGVYRGAFPDKDGLKYLEALQLKTDIDLEGFRLFDISAEKNGAAQDGIDFESEPLSSLPGVLSYFQPPITDQRVDKIMEIMADETQRPVYVHCEKGEDRTGLVVGLFRVLQQGWKPEDAWNEMLKFGYHPHFQALTRYFEKRTGWKPPKTQ